MDTLRESARLSNARYEGGLDSYLPVLDAERHLVGQEAVEEMGELVGSLREICRLFNVPPHLWDRSPAIAMLFESVAAARRLRRRRYGSVHRIAHRAQATYDDRA